MATSIEVETYATQFQNVKGRQMGVGSEGISYPGENTAEIRVQEAYRHVPGESPIEAGVSALSRVPALN